MIKSLIAVTYLREVNVENVISLMCFEYYPAVVFLQRVKHTNLKMGYLPIQDHYTNVVSILG